MNIEKMTKQQEADLVDAISSAIKDANAGAHPNEALYKVAQARGWTANFVKRAVEAFNVSKSIKHRQSAQGDAKAAAFDIADADVILKRLYPEQVETPAEEKAAGWLPAGVHVDESRVFDPERAPVLNKRAVSRSHGPADIEQLMSRACNELYRQERVVASHKQAMAEAREDMLSGIRKLASYFRTSVHEPFERVESAVLQYDSKSKPLMDTVWQLAKRASLGRDTRASGPAKVNPVDRQPYAIVNDIFTARDKYANAAVKCAAVDKELTEYRSGLKQRMAVITKSAAGATLLPFMLGTLLPKGTTEGLKSFKTTATLSPEDITSAGFDAERKGIATQAMLHDFMTHDEVLRHAEPSAVVQAFNDISSVAPRAAEEPLVLRGLLRKAVEGVSYDPYESANLVNMEYTLKKRDLPMSKMDKED